MSKLSSSKSVEICDVMFIREKKIDCINNQLIKLNVCVSRVLFKKLCYIIFSSQSLNNQSTDFIKAVILFK